MSKFKNVLCPIILMLFSLLILNLAYSENPDDQKVVKILRTTNKAQVMRYVPKVYTFNQVNPHEIVNYFTAALACEEGGAYTFVAPDGKSGKLLVICPEHQIPYFDKLAAELDRSQLTSAPGSKYIYYRFKHRSALDSGLRSVLSFYGGGPGEALVPDRETNSMLIYDAPQGALDVAALLEKSMDAPTPQVQIALKIYEVNVSNAGALGQDFISWKNGIGRNLFNWSYAGDYLKLIHPDDPNKFTLRTSSWGYYVEYPSAYFDFLVSKSKAKVLVETRLSAMNGSTASFQTGDQVLYYYVDSVRNVTGATTAQSQAALNLSKRANTQGNTSQVIETIAGATTYQVTVNTDTGVIQGITQSSAPINRIQAVPTGILFTATPRIGTEMINMDLLVKVADLVGYQDNGIPIINSRQIADSIVVPKDTEIMLGGLTRENVIKTTKKFPILGSIPILGWFFGGENQIKQKAMVVMAIKPVVITDFSGMTTEDRNVIKQVAADAPTPSPEALAGFDQFLLDNEK